MDFSKKDVVNILGIGKAQRYKADVVVFCYERVIFYSGYFSIGNFFRRCVPARKFNGRIKWERSLRNRTIENQFFIPHIRLLPFFVNFFANLPETGNKALFLTYLVDSHRTKRVTIKN